MKLKPLINVFRSSVAIAATASLLAMGCAEEQPVVTETSATVVDTPAPGTGGDPALVAPPTSTDPDALSATAGEVVRNPTQYHGRVVTVTGSVEEVADPRAFTIETGITPTELLVLSRDPVPGVVEAGTQRSLLGNDEVIVTGRIVNMTVPQIETDIGWDLARELEVEFENQPVLIIEKMTAEAGTQPN